ncbi:ankyrin repeat-containing domain protein [Xylaria digitata]|nr:ankyrin repeat-containing domain protein [Xylaria digitata]
MPSALCLPIELLCCISEYLDYSADLSSWSRSCRVFHVALTPLLYHNVKDKPTLMLWACEKGRLDTVRHLLNAGADPNVRCEVEFQPIEDHNPHIQLPSLNNDFDLNMIEHFEEGYYHVKLWPDGAGPYSFRKSFWTPLHIATACGNDKLVVLLLDNGADINALSHAFCSCVIPPRRDIITLWTPLHTSICRGRASTTRLLLSRGASTKVMPGYQNPKTKRHFTALHSACIAGLLDAARGLVDGGYQTDVTVRDHKDLAPLAYAFFRGNWGIIDFLLEHGADINAKMGSLNALGYACLLGYYAEALRLLDLGAKVEGPNYFHLIAVAGARYIPSSRSSEQKKFRLELVEKLIKCGIDVNDRGLVNATNWGTSGTTALIRASSFHRVDVVKALLRSGADVRATHPIVRGKCALEKAVRRSSNKPLPPKGAMVNTVKTLLERMAETPDTIPRLVDINVQPDTIESNTDDDITAKAIELRVGCHGKHEDRLEVLALLLRYETAVEIAKIKCNLVYTSMVATDFDISNLLLKNGFSQLYEPQLEYLMREFIRTDNFKGLCYILDHFSEIDPGMSNGRLLCSAVYFGRENCVELLINRGVSIKSRDVNNNSLLVVACMQRHRRIVRLLLENGVDPDEWAQKRRLIKIMSEGDAIKILLLFLDYGASIHSFPPEKPTRYPPGMGLLDAAICNGYANVVKMVLEHKNYGSPTDEEISTHWQNIINPPFICQVHVFKTLFDSKRFDKDQIFTITDTEHCGVVTTPLHLSAAISLTQDKTSVIHELIRCGANIHKRLPIRQKGQVNTPGPESKPKDTERFNFDGTTPLEWAIDFSSISAVRALLVKGFEYDQSPTPETETPRMNRTDMILYAKAACRRQDPKMLFLLFEKGLDHTICDEDGNTMVHMICDYVKTFWPNDNPEQTMEGIAERSAFPLIACLQQHVPYEVRNKNGDSGLDRALQIMKYSGPCEFHQILAKHWRERIDYVEG